MRYVITTIYNGQRKFIHNAGRHSVAVESVSEADCFNDIDLACEAAHLERRSHRWCGFNWHDAIHPVDALDSNNGQDEPPEPDDRDVCDPIAEQRMDAADFERVR